MTTSFDIAKTTSDIKEMLELIEDPGELAAMLEAAEGFVDAGDFALSELRDLLVEYRTQANELESGNEEAMSNLVAEGTGAFVTWCVKVTALFKRKAAEVTAVLEDTFDDPKTKEPEA